MSVRVCRLTDLGVFTFHAGDLASALWWARFLRDRWNEACWVEATHASALRRGVRVQNL